MNTLGAFSNNKNHFGKTRNVQVMVFAARTLVLAGFILCYLMKNQDVAFLLIITFFLLLLDFKMLLTIRNFILSYFFFLLVVGGKLRYSNTFIEQSLWCDFMIYSAVFTLAYSFFHILPKKLVYKEKQFNIGKLLKKKRALEKRIMFLTLILYGTLIGEIFRVGFKNFYTGQVLVEKIAQYGSYSVTAGLSTIGIFLLNTLLWATAIFYISLCYIVKSRPRMGYLVFAFVLFPLFSLSRWGFMIGIIFILFSSFIVKKKIEWGKVAIAATLVAVIVTWYGVIRERAFHGMIHNKSFPQMIMLTVQGELSQVVAYVEIKENIKQLGYQYGKTILLPLALKMVPRSFWPSKPYNSSAYYMHQLHKNMAEAGFFRAPSILGDLFLNFGYIGCIVGVFILGMCGAYFDCIIKAKGTITRYRKVALTVLLFTYCYTFLRNNISDSLFLIFGIYIVFLLISHSFKCK